MNVVYDAVVVGGGLAGLSCAETLLKAGVSILLIEGRSRLGGRVLSLPIPRLSCQAELGAEFIHGTPHELMRMVNSHPIPIFDVCDEHLFLKRKHLSKIKFWDRIEAVSAKLKQTKADMSVERFIKRARLPTEDKALYRAYVEGFHSADLNLMGAKALLGSENQMGGELNGSSLFRVSEGYANALTRRFLQSDDFMRSVRLKTVLKKISARGTVINLDCEGPEGAALRLRTNKLILSVPIGVLKAPPRSRSGIVWEPEVKTLRDSLALIHMGHVQRIVFYFRSRFWEELCEKDPIGFLHAGPEFHFPTWWTLMPLRVPLLVAWQGGPKALALSSRPVKQRVAVALATLASITRRSDTFLRKELLNYFSHDWSADPFSLGAYSYIGVGGSRRAEKISRPVDRRIFFAGEGTIHGPARGTVHGAIRSGLRAARQVVDSS